MEFHFEFEEFMKAPKGAELLERFQRSMKGVKQNTLGDKRKKLAEGFVNILNPKRRELLEKEISALHTINDEGSFRVQFLLILFDAFGAGMRFEQKYPSEKKQG